MQPYAPFLQAVLPDSGYVALERIGPEIRGMLHTAFDNKNALIAALNRVNPTTCDCYFAIASFKTKKSRKGENADKVRSFVLDADVKEGNDKFYQNKDEAWDGIWRFVQASGLPYPIVVDSGGGYHVYWPLTADLDRDEWVDCAAHFKSMVGQLEPKLVADATRVADAAGVLRIPGTFNLKNGGQRPVYVAYDSADRLDIDDFRAVLNRYPKPVTHVAPANPGIDGLGELPEHLRQAGAGVQLTQDTKVELRAVLKNCEWVKHYAANVGDATEPEWYGVLGLAPYIEHTRPSGRINGVGVAELLSQGHPDYDPRDTQIKFEHARDSQTGPTTCARLRGLNSEPCSRCEFAAIATTPVHAARLVKADTEQKVVEVHEPATDVVHVAELPAMPRGYFPGENDKGVWQIAREQGDDGQWTEERIMICALPVYVTKRYYSPKEGMEYMELLVKAPHKGWVAKVLPSSLLGDNKRFTSEMAGRGILAEDGFELRFFRYVKAAFKQAQREMIIQLFDTLGWQDLDKKNPSFVVSNGYYDHDGTFHPSALAPSMSAAAMQAGSEKGSLELWKQGYGIYNRIPNSEAHIFAALIGFAAPAMALTDYRGILFSLVGSSGAGKTVAMRVAASVFGRPNENHVLVRDTQIARANIISMFNSIPVMFDEMTKMAPEEVSEFSLHLTSGRGKERAKIDGTNRQNTASWSTIVMGSTNTPLYDKLSESHKGHNADAMRIFELQVPKADVRHRPSIDAALTLLNANHGVAGRVLMGPFMMHRDKLRNAIARQTEEILRQTNGGSSERFWATLIAAVYVMGRFAQALGLHDYDMERVKRWIVGQVETTREYVEANNSISPVSVLGDILNSNLGNITVFIDKTPKLSLSMAPAREIRGRADVTTGKGVTKLSISGKYLSEYCAQSKIDRRTLISACEEIGIEVQYTSVRLAANVLTEGALPVKCWVFKFSGNQLQVEDTDERATGNHQAHTLVEGHA